MNNLTNSVSLHQLRKQQNFLTETKLIDHIIKEAKFFIALDSKFSLRETKSDFIKGKQKFLMVDIKEIKYLKTHSQNIHFLINEKTDHVLISLSMAAFVHSGLYISRRLAAKDIKLVMCEYENRRQTYQHNLSQTNKGIEKLMNAASGIMDSYPESFI